MKKTERVKIVTGLSCNIQCIFCYYRDNLKTSNRKIKEIQKDLLFARKNRISQVDFSGGEPTMHPELGKMITFAKNIGIETVCIISNGIRLSNKNYLKQLQGAGLDEVLFSVHGSNSEIHDAITQCPGSHKKISKALENTVDIGLTVRTNTVVNKINFKDLPDTAEFIKAFSPLQVNFITINDWCFAKELVGNLMLSYSDMSYRLKKACDLLENEIPHINVRYIPFCFMKGYERFVCNHMQVPYDMFEWVPRIRSRLEMQNTLIKHMAILAYGFIVGGMYKELFRTTWPDFLDRCVTQALHKRFYEKHKDCKHCRFNYICDGVENTYARNFGLEELKPDYGERLTNPVFFRQ